MVKHGWPFITDCELALYLKCLLIFFPLDFKLSIPSSHDSATVCYPWVKTLPATL